MDIDIAATHEDNAALKERDKVQKFLEKLSEMKDLVSDETRQWIGSLPRRMAEDAIPLFTDNDTDTGYQLHFSYSWMSALHSTGFSFIKPPDRFIHSLLHVTNSDNCEVVSNPSIVIPLGKLFVNKSGSSHWTGYKVVASSSLELWIIYILDEVGPERSYPVECSLSRCIIPGDETDRRMQTENSPNFKIARLWTSLSTLPSATFEKAVEKIRVSNCEKYMGSFCLLEHPRDKAPQVVSLAKTPVDKMLMTRRLMVNANSIAGRGLLSLAYKKANMAIFILMFEEHGQSKNTDDLVSCTES
jgi:hypothetical protein